MPSAETANRDEPTGLSSSRAEFAASLGRRLESVLGALTALEQQPESSGRRDNFLRRVHALGASAKVLGFAAAAETFARAEQQIRTAQGETLADDAIAVRRYLSDLPGLVLRGTYSLVPQSRPATEARSNPPHIAEPIAVLAWGTSACIDVLRSLDPAGTTLELSTVDAPEKLRESCAALGPDVLVLDANQGSITLLVDELAQSPETANVAIVVVNVPDGAATGIRELGARVVLPAQFTEQQLARALTQARHVPAERPPSPAPIGEVTLKDLAERLAQEIREGLVDAAEPSSQIERFQIADGTPIRAALWSALARIREQIAECSDGRVQFVSGPEGAVPLAPSDARSSSARQRTELDSVDLSGRRILVVDDDPAVAWFVSGTLRAAGAIVTEALDGARALQIAYRLWPELIVSDVIMPGLDGFALCHAVKRDVLLRDVPIVLLSWKEDLLFRLRDLGADADGYLRKEASASTIVRRVKELLRSRCALERRLQSDQETRGRLDGTTTRSLLELTAGLQRPVRIALRDAAGLFEMRLRHGALVSVTRTRHDGSVEQGQAVLGAMLAITAGRFSVVTDRDACEPMFNGSLQEILEPAVLRARAAQRLLSGAHLGEIDRLTLAADAFGQDLPTLPLSLRPIADELRRGTAPRQLLASGVASVQLLESLLADVARRGAVLSVIGPQGEDLLEQEILQLSSSPSVPPPKPSKAPPPLFTFQLSPNPPDARTAMAPTSPTPTVVPAVARLEPEPAHGTARDLDSGVLSGVDRDPEAASRSGDAGPSHLAHVGSTWPGESLRVAAGSLHPASKAPPTDDIDWAMELSWDSTPPPVGANTSGALDHFEGRPPTSGGFMRPAIATLERRKHDETPDLANAVVRAVSEATPAVLGASTVAGASTVPGASTVAGASTDGRNDWAGASTAPTPIGQPSSTSLATEPVAGIPTLTLTLPTSGAVATIAIGSTPTGTIGSTPTGTIGSTPTGTIGTAPDARVAPKSEHAEVTAQQSQARTPPGPPAGPVLARTDVNPDAAETKAHSSSVSFLDASSLERTTFAESPNALPVVHQPPRPKLETIATKTKEPFLPVDRDVEDPVFPLVSTANVAVLVQPSIDVGPQRTALESAQSAETQAAPEPLAAAEAKPLETAPDPLAAAETKPLETAPDPLAAAETKPLETASESLAAAETKPLETAPAVENRDTLRSPGDTLLDGQAPSYQSAVALSGAPSRKGKSATGGPGSDPAIRPPSADLAPNGDAPRVTSPTKSGAPSASSRPPSSNPPVSQTTRPVGWIQALGLAALAGIVTFAVTVPIASWIRRRQEPTPTSPPIATEVLSPANVGASLASNGTNDPTRAPSAATVDAGVALSEADAAPSGAPAAAKIEDIPMPSDVNLQPGQALIEVSTGGGHAIFLDDAFVGRGPLRVIPVQPGRHVVRTRLNGVERNDPVDVSAGRSVRLSLEQAWK